MPLYRYTATDTAGKTVHGTATAADPSALYVQLRNEGRYLTKQTEVRDKKRLSGRRLRTAQVADFSRELGTLLSAGVPLVRALAILSEQEGLDPSVKRLYEEIQADIRKGVPLSDAMDAHSPAFPELLVGMIRSAEGTGSIDQTARRMGVHYEKEHRMNQEVGNTMMYPAILAVMVVAVVAILLTYVVPQFEPLFAQMESLPWPTELLLGGSAFLKAHWLPVLIGVAIAAALLRLILRLPPVRLVTGRLELKLPVVGRLRRKVYTARFARTLSNLYSSGVPIVASLTAARGTIGNDYIISQFDTVLSMVRTGRPLSEALATVDGFERKLTSSVQVGEETGKLDEMLATISENMDYEAEMATKKLMTLLEPLMIVIMAVIVAFVIIAVILPIYQSYATIGASGSAF